MVIDKIVNHMYSKSGKTYRRMAIGILVLACIHLLMSPIIYHDGFTWFTVLSMSIGSVPLLIHSFFSHRNKRGQFIEWSEEAIVFKNKKYSSTKVLLKDIKSIEIGLDVVEIETKEKTYKIDIEDYTEYEDRLRLKRNFRSIASELGIQP
jgi:hypothetical protein